jgi:hypothetical protein
MPTASNAGIRWIVDAIKMCSWISLFDSFGVVNLGNLTSYKCWMPSASFLTTAYKISLIQNSSKGNKICQPLLRCQRHHTIRKSKRYRLDVFSKRPIKKHQLRLSYVPMTNVILFYPESFYFRYQKAVKSIRPERAEIRDKILKTFIWLRNY